MDNRDYMILLYDCYSMLFSDKQRSYFEDYYFNNLSLGEISDNIGVSRNAIHKVIKTVEERLLFYESVLQIYKKDKIVKDLILECDDEGFREKLKELL